MIQERYLSFFLEKLPKYYNEKYKTYELKGKLCKHFGNRLAFWQPRTKAELVYAADIGGEAVEVAFEIAASDERRPIETAMVIRRIIKESRRDCEQMPWTHQLIGCFLGARRPPEILLTFFFISYHWVVCQTCKW